MKVPRSLFLTISLICCAVDALLVTPSQQTTVGNTPTTGGTQARTYVTEDMTKPYPIPVEGQQAALELMQSGRLYRYEGDPGDESVTSLCEQDIADYTGFRYCVALNSCGSALMLLLKTTGLQPGGKVLSNAFTFGAVPSAIVHAGGKPVYVESNRDLVIDVRHLEKKLRENPDCSHVLISHMRGLVADMDEIQELCSTHNAILLEDCAHSLGVKWQGLHTGHKGIACAISSQSHKMINSGEGGFLLTDNPEIASEAAVLAGAYEGTFAKHTAIPEPRYFQTKPMDLPNFSLRMSNLAAAVLRPQMKTLEGRIEATNKRYSDLVDMLRASVGKHLYIPQLTMGVTHMVHDSIQFILDEKFTPTMIEEFLEECEAHGLPVELFGHEANARNFAAWGFAPAEEPLPETEALLMHTVDFRLPHGLDAQECGNIGCVIIESIESVLAKHGLDSTHVSLPRPHIST